MLACGYLLSRVDTIKSSWARDAIIVFIASMIIALFGSVEIPLPYPSAPITLQPHVCLFFGVLLGSKRGSMAVLCFLLEGMMGFPVLSGFAGGIHHFFGPTGGYLIGYLVGTYVCGYLWERASVTSLTKCVLSFTAGTSCIYLFGVARLSAFIGIGPAIAFGFLPFLFGNAIKICIVVKILRSIKSVKIFE